MNTNSCNQQAPTSQNRRLLPMSSSLKNKLKRCGRYHPGTLTVCGDKSPTAATDTITTNVIEPLSITQSSESNVDVLGHSKEKCLTPSGKSVDIKCTTAKRASCDVIKRRKLCHVQLKEINRSNSAAVDASSLYSPSFSVTGNIVEQKTGVVSAKEEVCPSNLVFECGSNINRNACDNNPQCSIHDEKFDTMEGLKSEKNQLEQILKTKEEQLRKLKMVKMYREKNDLTELQRLIDTWRKVSQRVLVDLHEHHPSPRPTMTDLINHLQIDHELISYDPEEETFS